LRTRKVPDTSWLLGAAGKVLTMQAGFGLLESAMCRKMNATNVMMKNVGDLVLAALFYFAFGYSLSFGKDLGGFGLIGDPTGEVVDYASCFFHFSFAATAATIDSGCLAERVNFFTYLILSSFTTAVSYPIVCHWAWHPDGWLFKAGYVDFAGSSVVHLLGACSGFCAMMIAGPRIGRFSGYRTWQSSLARWFFHEKYTSIFYRRPAGDAEERNFVRPLPIANPVQALFGTLVLWIGWYGFNGGSTQGLTSDLDMSAAKVYISTTLGAGGGGVAAMALSIFAHRKQGRMIVQVPDVCTGVLAGLVGVTAGAAHFRPSIACLSGALSGLFSMWFAHVLESFQFDDVVSAVPIHGASGFLGVVFVGLFAESDCAFPAEARADSGKVGPQGIFFGGELSFLGVQFLGATAITAWGFLSTWLLISILRMMPHEGLNIRAHRWDEIVGMDICEHGYDDNSDYHEESERSEMVEAFSDPKIQHFLVGRDTEEKDRGLEEWLEDRKIQHARTREQSLVERLETLERWNKVRDKSLARLERRVERGYGKRLEFLESQMTTLAADLSSFIKQTNGTFAASLSASSAKSTKGSFSWSACMAANSDMEAKQQQQVNVSAKVADEGNPFGYTVADLSTSELVPQTSADLAWRLAEADAGAKELAERCRQIQLPVVLPGAPQMETGDDEDEDQDQLQAAVRLIEHYWCRHKARIGGGGQLTMSQARCADIIDQVTRGRAHKPGKRGGFGKAFHSVAYKPDPNFSVSATRADGAGAGGWMGLAQIGDGRGR